MEITNPWFYGKDYLIISKKGDTVSCFSYLIDHKKILEGGELPKGLRDVYWDSTYSAFTKEVGFNPYLAVRPIAPDSAFRIWRQISKLEPWQINDDQADGDGCPVGSNGMSYYISDANMYVVTLITKEGSKALQFYAPDYFDTYCPGREGRKRLRVRQDAVAFSSSFPSPAISFWCLRLY